MSASRRKLNVVLASSIALALVVGTFVFYRNVYSHSKRLRIVVPGRVYRSGQMTADGFADAVKRYNIKTIVNLQNEYPDPDLVWNYWNRSTIKESELCKRLGVDYVVIEPDLVPRRTTPENRPMAIDEFLHLMDDESIYPVLFHCKAGLHRTGVLAAVYRMEYQGWTMREAYQELKAHGFGDSKCTCANDYVMQYVIQYTPGLRKLPAADRASRTESREDTAHD